MLAEWTKSHQKQIEEIKSVFERFFLHPKVVAAATFIGIAGTIFGVYAFFAADKKPDLTYYVSPTRTAILQKGSLKNLTVAYRGLPIDGDLSSAEVQIWNAGKQAIHQADILQPLLLKISNGARIYETTITPKRNVIGIDPTSNLENLATGIVPINFKILEQNDGIKVQIIYGGDVNLPLILDGIIEGQPQGFSEFKQSSSLKRFYVQITIVTLLGAVLGFILAIFFIPVRPKDPHLRQRLSLMMLMALIFFSGLMCFYELEKLVHDKLKPPFGP